MGTLDVEKFVNGLHEYLEQELKPLAQRIKELEQRGTTGLASRVAELEEEIKELRARGGLEYKGTYQAGENYRKGDAVTHSGSLWICKVFTDTAPPGPSWNLAVKRGKDGAR